jgi:transposase
MLSVSSSTRIYLCRQVTDMRRGFDGLAQMTRDILKQDPLNGHLFLFRNRRGDRLKVLYWDGDGFALWYKRLEKGTYRLPSGEGAEISRQDLMLLLEGLDRKTVKKRIRYSR